jgi:hypothetical protein
MDLTPPSPETVQSAITLLARVPNVWTPVPELSHLDGKALGLLVAGGPVERRVCLRLRGIGDSKAVAVRFHFTGQAGLVQALEPALRESWELWGRNGGKVYVEPCNGEGEWRLTDQGEQAAQEARSGNTAYLKDFLRTPGVPGIETMAAPMRFVPGLHRPVVNGEGQSERVEVVNADSKPLSVKVENLTEVAGPLAEIRRAVEEGLQKLADKQAGITVAAQLSDVVVAPKSDGPKTLAQEIPRGTVWEQVQIIVRSRECLEIRVNDRTCGRRAYGMSELGLLSRRTRKLTGPGRLFLHFAEGCGRLVDWPTENSTVKRLRHELEMAFGIKGPAITHCKKRVGGGYETAFHIRDESGGRLFEDDDEK